MSLAKERERRINAGNKMARIMNEEEDEFYNTTYGGFADADDDDDYKEEKEVEDITDSDISIDENDELISDNEDEEPKKKKRGVLTKAYREPRPVSTPQKRPGTTAVAKARKQMSKIMQSKVEKLERKSIRRSTAAKSAATIQRLKSRIEIQKRRRKRTQESWKPTQEELLKEAKLTEEENLKSLEKYQKLELEKKKSRIVKKIFTGPVIRYQSLAMPVVEELPDERVNVDSDENKEDKTDQVNPNEKDKDKKGQKIERTFITFEDGEALKEVFSPTKKDMKPKYCPFTRLKAKYFDPVTNLPFGNLQAFRILREAYYQQLEARANKSQPQIEAWLQWRRQQREVFAKRILGNSEGVVSAKTC